VKKWFTPSSLNVGASRVSNLIKALSEGDSSQIAYQSARALDWFKGTGVTNYVQGLKDAYARITGDESLEKDYK